jgi:hypothetical protein
MKCLFQPLVPAANLLNSLLYLSVSFVDPQYFRRPEIAESVHSVVQQVTNSVYSCFKHKYSLGHMKDPNPLQYMVPEAGLEPARGFPRGILSPLRLPIPPLGQA